MKKKAPLPSSAAPAAPTTQPAQKQPQPAAPPVPTAAPDANKEANKPAPADNPPGANLSEVPVTSPVSPEGPRPASVWSPPPNFFKLDPPSLELMDWAALRKPFLDRGAMMSGRDGASIETSWMQFYKGMFWATGNTKLAAAYANFAIPNYIDLSLRADGYSTTVERFDRETERLLPPGQGLGKIVVPLITPDTLSWSVEKLTGKKIDFHF
ncbi:MAG: hypothetical protein JNM66_10055 [Bryobacterales bacterium]|nr:hypothetical protein [Bryobacterales bacterium]